MSRLQISFAALFVCGAVLAVGQPPEKAVIGYIYSPNRPLVPRDVAAEKLTHINYAFANIKDGLMVEGYAGDAENYRTLNNLKERNPKLKILVSVGGWTWSGVLRYGPDAKIPEAVWHWGIAPFPDAAKTSAVWSKTHERRG